MPLFFLVRIPPTPLERAIALIKTNKAAAALPILEEISQRQPEDHDVLPWLALSYLSTDRLAEGRTALDTAIKVKLPCATIVPAIESYSRYYQQKNDFAEADRLLLSAQHLCPDAATSKQRGEIYIAWSNYDRIGEDIENAARHLELALQYLNDPTKKDELGHQLADYYRQLATKAEVLKDDNKRALELLEKSLAAYDEPATRMAMGNIYSRVGNYGKAIEQYAGVAEMDPNNLEARHHMVDLYLRIDNTKGAQTVLSELADKERCVENYELLAALHMRLGNYAGAVKSLEDASGLSPNDEGILSGLHNALLDWSAALAHQGKQDQASSTRGRAERIAEILKTLDINNPDNPTGEVSPESENANIPDSPPFSLYASRTWLSKGSYTPEGEIRVKNISPNPLTDLSLTIIFYDNTRRRRTGEVTISAASSSHPLLPKQIRSLYFSSPNIVRTESQLCIIILWKGKLLTQLPVVKER